MTAAPGVPARAAWALDAVRQQFPRTDLVVRTTAREEVTRGVATGRFDVGLVDGVAAPSDPLRLADIGLLDVVEVSQEPLVVVLEAGHPLAGRSSLQLDNLVDARWIDATEVAANLTDLRAAVGSGAISAALCYEGHDTSSLLELVAAGHGLAVLPARVVRHAPGTVAVALRSPSSRASSGGRAWQRPPAGGQRLRYRSGQHIGAVSRARCAGHRSGVGGGGWRGGRGRAQGTQRSRRESHWPPAIRQLSSQPSCSASTWRRSSPPPGPPGSPERCWPTSSPSARRPRRGLETRTDGGCRVVPAGGSCGWAAMCERGVNPATVVAASRARLLVMRPAQFRAVAGLRAREAQVGRWEAQVGR